MTTIQKKIFQSDNLDPDTIHLSGLCDAVIRGDAVNFILGSIFDSYYLAGDL